MIDNMISYGESQNNAVRFANFMFFDNIKLLKCFQLSWVLPHVFLLWWRLLHNTVSVVSRVFTVFAPP
uniref:Uncharacterized protein n=1 Tax=Manihot esculenta TaxID=3983 RepID=A0A2C9UQ10_MANES